MIDTERERKKSSLYPMRCSSSLLPSVWCWRQQRLVLPATPEAADTHTTYRHTRKKIGLFLSHFFILPSLKTQGHTHTHIHTQKSSHAGSTQCRKSQLYAYSFAITEAVLSTFCECLDLRLYSCTNNRNYHKSKGEKGGDGLFSVYHPRGEKMWCQKGKSVFMA